MAGSWLPIQCPSASRRTLHSRTRVSQRDLTAAITKTEPSGGTGSGLSLLLLWISGRPAGQRRAAVRGGDKAEAAVSHGAKQVGAHRHAPRVPANARGEHPIALEAQPPKSLCGRGLSQLQLASRSGLCLYRLRGGRWFEPSIVHSGSHRGFGYFRSSRILGLRPQCVPEIRSRACRMASAAGMRGSVSSSRIVPA